MANQRKARVWLIDLISNWQLLPSLKEIRPITKSPSALEERASFHFEGLLDLLHMLETQHVLFLIMHQCILYEFQIPIDLEKVVGVMHAMFVGKESTWARMPFIFLWGLLSCKPSTMFSFAFFCSHMCTLSFPLCCGLAGNLLKNSWKINRWNVYGLH